MRWSAIHSVYLQTDSKQDYFSEYLPVGRVKIVALVCLRNISLRKEAVSMMEPDSSIKFTIALARFVHNDSASNSKFASKLWQFAGALFVNWQPDRS